ncbi:hypothetical protein KXD40_000274 [Peronospora effusa]|nr:hypothetical protein KXD40_000274 [Peronospora effusa]
MQFRAWQILDEKRVCNGDKVAFTSSCRYIASAAVGKTTAIVKPSAGDTGANTTLFSTAHYFFKLLLD